VDESSELHAAYGGDPRWDRPILLDLAFHGREAIFAEAYERIVRPAELLGFGSAVVTARAARGELLVGLGRYADVVDELREVYEADTLGVGTALLPTLVEAAVRATDDELGQRALNRLRTRAAAAATPWAEGLVARCRALVARPDEAEGLYVESLTRLTAAQMPLDLARARLLYGEWLRRERRRTDAIEHLAAAHEAFATMGAEAFAGRAGAELHAAGGRAGRRSVETSDPLTAQERRVAIGAASGATNREIASTMFISEATVAYHLRKVFHKLGITSRRQLRGVDLT
jgi:DNA-binding CsgD family transcriptional regulator